jgi:hypothetical protein
MVSTEVTQQQSQQQQQHNSSCSSPSSCCDNSRSNNDDVNPQPHSTYEELKWNDKPLYCPDDFGLQDIDNKQDKIVQSSTTGEGINSTITSTSGGTCAPPTTHDTKYAPTRIPIHAGKTALLIVDVQPEYWSSCPSVRQDFPHFEENLARTIEIARRQRSKIIWVRADYRKHHSPWLIQFERLNRGQRPDTIVELPCEPESEEFKWEDFATPGKSKSKIGLLMILQSKPTKLFIHCVLTILPFCHSFVLHPPTN